MVAFPNQQEQLKIALPKNYLHQMLERHPSNRKKSNSLNGRLKKQKLYTEAFKLPGCLSAKQAVCHVCVTAYKQNLIASSVLEPACISRGFTIWKDAIANKMGFPSHDRSDCQKEAVERLMTLI